jgi:hypothetical protein
MTKQFIRNNYQRINAYGDYLICMSATKPLYDIFVTRQAKAQGKKLDPLLSDSMWSSISEAVRKIDYVEGQKHSLHGTSVIWDSRGAEADERAYNRVQHLNNAEEYFRQLEDTKAPKTDKKPIKDVKPVKSPKPVKYGVLADDYSDFERI